MASVLEIANAAADDLSLDPIATLYGTVEPGDTTARRMRRAIERTCHYLRSTLAWDSNAVEHTFATVAGELQTGAIPDDFVSFVGNTMFDHARQMAMFRVATADEYTALKTLQIGNDFPRWIKLGNEILISPTVASGHKISYQYTSNAICIEPPVAHQVVTSTSTPLQLAAHQRCVLRHGDTVRLPVLADGETVELVPASGTWDGLGANIETPGDVPLRIIDVDAASRDIVTVMRYGGGYGMTASIGAWVEPPTSTTNGMTLEVGRRYVVQQGHVVHLPIMAPTDRIELIPADGSWTGLTSRLVTRPGLTISPELPPDTKVAVIVADMSATPAYTLTAVSQWTSLTWSVSGQAQRGRGRRKPRITSDRDVPLWADELMTLGAVWLFNWRDGQPYGEDFRAFERAIYSAFAGQGVSMIDMGAGSTERRLPRRFTAIIDSTLSG